MTQALPRSRKWIWIVAIVVIAGIIMIAFIPSSTVDGTRLRGSTYSRHPSGYLAWYDYMRDRGTPLTRWEKPLDELRDAAAEEPMTLVRVNSVSRSWSRGIISRDDSTWLNDGNHLIIVGVRGAITEAPFRTTLSHPVGDITIETRRRNSSLLESDTSILSDDAGALAWQTPQVGDLIVVGPLDFAANAYRDAPGNYEFLAELVSERGDRLFVDEYSHGYRETEVIEEEVAISWVDYLANTPLVLLLGQGIVIVMLFLWAKNRRSRPPIPLETPTTNNTQAYIQALAGVLQKAECHDFVVSVIGQEEQRLIQRQLGLGRDLLDPDHMLQAWQQSTGHPASDLNAVMRPYWNKQSLNQLELQAWLRSLENVHMTLNRVIQ